MEEQGSKLNFWISCPKCKERFGIKAELVFKFLDRLLEELEKELKVELKKAKER